MPQRQIVVGKDVQEEQDSLKESVTEESSVKINTSNFSKSGVIITSDELRTIFNEWNLNANNDLIILPEMASKMREWLDWQKELEELKVEMANTQFERFFIRENYIDGSSEFKVKLNDEYLMTARFYKTDDNDREIALSIENFRVILAKLKNPFSYYLCKDDSEDIYIDVRGWVFENGGVFFYDKYGYSDATVCIKFT